MTDNTDIDSGENGKHIEENSTDASAESADEAMVESDGRLASVAQELVAAQEVAKENHEKHLRALAEFENYKRRTTKERSELLKYQGEALVVELLNIFDNLELALQHKEADADKLRTGLEMTYKGFLDALKKFEIRPESMIGKTFDPASASAISKVPASETSPAGTVIGELKKPFFYKDKLIRFGEAVVAVE